MSQVQYIDKQWQGRGKGAVQRQCGRVRIDLLVILSSSLRGVYANTSTLVCPSLGSVVRSFAVLYSIVLTERRWSQIWKNWSVRKKRWSLRGAKSEWFFRTWKMPIPIGTRKTTDWVQSFNWFITHNDSKIALNLLIMDLVSHLSKLDFISKCLLTFAHKLPTKEVPSSEQMQQLSEKLLISSKEVFEQCLK